MRKRFSKVSTEWLEGRVVEKRKHKDNAIAAIAKYEKKLDKYYKEINELIDEIKSRS